MEPVWTAVVAGVLAAWFLASVVHQFAPRWWRPVNRFDGCRLLPQWHFFAPRPGRRDHHLVVRDIDDRGPTPWRQLQVGGTSPIVRWIFNPYRYRQKALTDFVNMLLTARRLLAQHEAEAVAELISVPYLAVLTWVMAQEDQSRHGRRQFAVVTTVGHGAARDVGVVYVSREHEHHAADDL